MLFAGLQVLRGNIRVLCRVRPMQKQSPKGPGSSSASSSCCISVPLEGLLCVQDVATARMREFEFDAVFGPDASQQQVRLRSMNLTTGSNLIWDFLVVAMCSGLCGTGDCCCNVSSCLHHSSGYDQIWDSVGPASGT